MIRVLVIDDHPAVRAGLRAVLDLEPGFVFVGESSGDGELWQLLERTSPSVAIVDYHLASGDGLLLARELRRRRPALRTLLYTAYASPALALPAAVAGVDAMVRKDAGADELFDAIRLVHRGERVLQAPPAAAVEEARGRLELEELALVGLRIDGCSDEEAAEALGIEPGAVDPLVRRVLGKLHRRAPSIPGD